MQHQHKWRRVSSADGCIEHHAGRRLYSASVDHWDLDVHAAGAKVATTSSIVQPVNRWRGVSPQSRIMGETTLRRILIAAAASLLLTPVGFAADLPTAAPSDVGIGRLDRVTSFFKAD